MGKSNLDKFLEIESMMDEAKALMIPYEEALEERYEYMNDLRREYSNLSHTLGRIEQSIRKQSNDLEEDKDVKTVVKASLTKLDGHIEALEEENQYGEQNDAVKQLKRAIKQLDVKVNEDNIATAWRNDKDRNINIEEIDELIDLMDAIKHNGQESKEEIIRRINGVQNSYVSS